MPEESLQRYPRLNYENKLILAPMVKIGTLPTRLLALEFGADIVYTEEIIDFRILRSERIENRILNTIDYIDKTDDTLVLRISPRERGHLVLQIGTCDAQRAAKVAKMVENDVDGIDVNMGCPKSFSLKGGMGAALLTQPEKIKDILTTLVSAVNIPITCKIRVFPQLEKTLNLLKVIEQTGIAALAVHGRTKDERPNNEVHLDVIKEVVKISEIPIIANGGSSNNRNSVQNTYEGIRDFWAQTEASSVMVARAAEWNPSVFRKNGKAPIKEVVSKYMDLAIEFDYTFVMVKYNIQQILGSEQESEMGKRFLASSTLKDLCEIFGKEKLYQETQEKHMKIAGRNLVQNVSSENGKREVQLLPRKRKHSEREDEEVTEMFCPYIRGHYKEPKDIPKNILLQWTRQQKFDDPTYETKQFDKAFKSTVLVDGKLFGSGSSEKNKKHSEQSAALVALHCLGIKEISIDM